MKTDFEKDSEVETDCKNKSFVDDMLIVLRHQRGVFTYVLPQTLVWLKVAWNPMQDARHNKTETN